MIREEFLVKGKEGVKYISDRQSMKLGQCVSTISTSSLVGYTELKGILGADAGIIGSSQIRKALAHYAKEQPLFSRSGIYQGLQGRAGVCSVKDLPRHLCRALLVQNHIFLPSASNC